MFWATQLLRTPFLVLVATSFAAAGEDWLQYQGDARHSGDAPDREVRLPLGLLAAVPLSDSILTSPVIAGDHLYAVDAAGVAYCIDTRTFEVVWKYATPGGAANCNNVSSPAIAGAYLHFGTVTGRYYVLDRLTGRVVQEIACGDPIFSAPVVSEGRVYFATLGARVYAVEEDGTAAWNWDFVGELMDFTGDRWSGAAWQQHKDGRVTWRDHFCSSRDLAAFGRIVVIPAGGRTVFLEDTGIRTATARCRSDSQFCRRGVCRLFRSEYWTGGRSLCAVASTRQRGTCRDPAPARRQSRDELRAGYPDRNQPGWPAQLFAGSDSRA